MKRNIKSMLAVCLIASLLVPTIAFKNNTKSNSGSHNITVFATVDPNSEQ